MTRAIAQALPRGFDHSDAFSLTSRNNSRKRQIGRSVPVSLWTGGWIDARKVSKPAPTRRGKFRSRAIVPTDRAVARSRFRGNYATPW